MKLFLSFVLVALMSVAFADDIGPAKLLVVKDFTNELVVQGMDLSVKYELYNIGESAATEVELADSTFPENDFELVAGIFNVKWPKIAPGSNVTHVVVVRPIRSGEFNFTSAVVQYVASEGADTTFGLSSEVGEVMIMTMKDYQRMFADHFVDWAMFALWCIPSLLVPYLMYSKSRNKYSIKAKKN